MLARTGCTNTYEEYFLRGTAPELCSEHSGSKVSNSSSNEEESTKPTGTYKDDEEELELDQNDEEAVEKLEENVEDTNTNTEEEPEQGSDASNAIQEPIVNDITQDEENIVDNTTVPDNTNTINEPTNIVESVNVVENVNVVGDNTIF